jgi:hypothetical protein
MKTARRRCSIHQVVELMPGMWTLNRLARRSPSSHDPFTEAACPTCLQVAREAFQQQFPTLYTASALPSRKSASCAVTSC